MRMYLLQKYRFCQVLSKYKRTWTSPGSCDTRGMMCIVIHVVVTLSFSEDDCVAFMSLA